MNLVYTFETSPLGVVLAAASRQGLCFCGLWGDENYLINDLQKRFPGVVLKHDPRGLAPAMQSLVFYLNGQPEALEMQLDLIGTDFQKRVWQALLKIPYGKTTSYSQLALDMGLGLTFTRAVAHGCATNPVSLVVPCHRVLRNSGALGGYYWGLERKRALLEMEGALRPKMRQSPLFL